MAIIGDRRQHDDVTPSGIHRLCPREVLAIERKRQIVVDVFEVIPPELGEDEGGGRVSPLSPSGAGTREAPSACGNTGYLADEHAVGTLDCGDPELGATQFLGMISNFAFWPRLLLRDWHPTNEDLHRTVAEAVRAIIARYGSTT